MKTGDFRGAGPFAAEWILAEGRQEPPDNRPKTRWVEHADYTAGLALSEIGSPGAWIRAEKSVSVAP